jgi:hypothetical protein
MTTYLLSLSKPEPLATFVNQSRNGSGWTTAVARVWPEGSGYCGLCPREHCNLTRDTCLVSVKRYVADEDGLALSTIGYAWDLPVACDALPSHQLVK